MTLQSKSYYLYSAVGLYLGEVKGRTNEPLPALSTIAPPPTPTENKPFVVYVGGGWQLMETAPTANVYDRVWDFGWFITTNAFGQRFTLEEQASIEREQDNPDNPYRYTLRALMASLNRASYADLTDPRYTDAMQLLHALGIVTTARVQEIHMRKATWAELPQWRQAEFILQGYVPS